jgi:hypothetical protein
MDRVSDDDVRDEQEEIHESLAETLPLEEGHVLTGWLIAFETRGPDGKADAGHYYGPAAMTTWGVLGLLEWVRRVSLPAGWTHNEEEETD